MTLGEHGLPPQFALALKEGRLEMKDSTCPAIHAGLQAAEKGIPFIPLRGILGSDLLKFRSEWQVIDNPFSVERDPIVLVPAIKPEFTLFHAPAADRAGNVWIGVRRELMLMAHAAKRTLVTVERVEDRDFLTDDGLAAGTVPALYISALSVAERGAHPVGLAGSYDRDDEALSTYIEAARTRPGFERWLDRHVLARVPA
jgi:glutaconate CoA-transferase subunit A